MRRRHSQLTAAPLPGPWKQIGTVVTARGDTLRLSAPLPPQPDSVGRLGVQPEEQAGNDTIFVFRLAEGTGPVIASAIVDRRRHVSSIAPVFGAAGF